MIQSTILPAQNLTSQALETLPQDFEHPENLSDQDQTQHDGKNQRLQQSLPEKHHQTKEIIPEKQLRSLTFYQNSDSISFKKLNRLSRPNSSVAEICYIPQRNLLLVLLGDRMTVNIYSTINFNLIKVRKSPKMLTCFSYNAHLQKILVGGAENLLQIWNLKNFEIEVSSLEKGAEFFLSLDYVEKSNIIMVKTSAAICIYNTELENITNFQLPRYYGEWNSWAAEFHGITQELLFAVCAFQKQKRFYIINLKSKTLKEEKEFFVPPTSCVEPTENNPTSIFSCIMTHQASEKRDLFAVTQFTINPETENFEVCPITLTNHLFSGLKHLKNSPYFFAQKSGLHGDQDIFILSISKGQIEINRVLSSPSAITFEKPDYYFMIEGQSAVIKIDVEKRISVYSLSRMWQKLKTPEHQVLL